MTYYISPQKAIKKQQKLKKEINIRPLNKTVRTVAGADISFNRGSNIMYAGFVVLQLPNLREIARSLVIRSIDFPYIPGLLAFREIPPLEEAWSQLELKPDVVIVDGHGIAHPRRMGIATHLGLLIDHPTIGCAKNILTGTYREPSSEKGNFTYIFDGDEQIGMTYRSRTDVKPIFISPGHLVSFEDTRSVIRQCLTRYKLPETTRKAHQRVNELRRGEIEAGFLVGN